MNRRIALLAAIGLAFVFASPVHLPINNPNEGVRVYMVKAIVDDHTFAINDVMKKWGYIDDKSVRDGKLYSSKAPLMSMIGVATYGLARLVIDPLDRVPLTRFLRITADALPCFLLLLIFARGVWRRTKDEVIGDLVVVGTALGSCVLAYVHVFSGHSLAALATGVALIVALESGVDVVDDRRRARRLFVAGLAMASAVGAEYPAAVGIVPLALLLLWRQRQRALSAVGWLAAGGALPVVLVMVAHHVMFGRPWQTGYAMLENKQYNQLHGQGFFGIGDFQLERLAATLFSSEIGLFFYSPFLVAGVLWIIMALVRPRAGWTRDVGIAVCCSILFLCMFISGHAGWRGGWVVGPRYVSELVALFAIPAAFAFDALAERRPLLARAACAGLVTVAVVHSGLPGLFYPHLPETYRNPVYEFILPLVGRGFTPDSVALWLGASPRLSSIFVVVVLFAPLVIVTTRRLADLGPSTFGAGVAVIVMIVVMPNVAKTAPHTRAMEMRHQMNNWWPAAGNPVVDGVKPPPPRAQIAFDHAHEAFPRLQKDGCAPATVPGGAP